MDISPEKGRAVLSAAADAKEGATTLLQ